MPSRKKNSRKKHSVKTLPRKFATTSRKTSRKSKKNPSKKTKDIDKLRRKPKGIPNVPWKALTSMSKTERSEMPSHCLLDPSHLKYPICYKHSQDISCVGLQAAKKRAQLNRNDKIASKARELEKVYNCNEKNKWETREAAIFARS
jgi:flagellar biosynthesis GTPase FlhF